MFRNPNCYLAISNSSRLDSYLSTTSVAQSMLSWYWLPGLPDYIILICAIPKITKQKKFNHVGMVDLQYWGGSHIFWLIADREPLWRNSFWCIVNRYLLLQKGGSAQVLARYTLLHWTNIENTTLLTMAMINGHCTVYQIHFGHSNFNTTVLAVHVDCSTSSLHSLNRSLQNLSHKIFSRGHAAYVQSMSIGKEFYL